MTVSYPQFIGAMLIIGLVVLIGYLVLVVAGQREVAELREKIALVGTKETAHLQEAEIHIARISKLESQVESLMTQPQARKDPFTGTEGRALEARVDALEQKVRELQ